MKEDTSAGAAASTVTWETLESFARVHVQSFIQGVLEEEITALLGRAKSQRRDAVDAPVAYRNGHGKPRRLSMQAGTVIVKRPRVRGLEERFESRVLPLFERRTKEAGICSLSCTCTVSRTATSNSPCAACSATARRCRRRPSSG